MSNAKYCGFCSLLSGLLRRAMCIGSHSGSTFSDYREIGDQDTLKIDGSQGSENSIEIIDDNEAQQGEASDVHVRAPTFSFHQVREPLAIQEPSETIHDSGPSTSRVIVAEMDNAYSDSEVLRTPEVARNRPTGRFHSTHKRYRRRLPTRSLMGEEALLDDLLIGQVQCVLDHSASWDFNAFTLDNVAGGRGLPVLCVHLFQAYGLISEFRLDPVKVWKLFALFEENYHTTNPYHNSIHAADVTQAMHCFLRQDKILKYMKPVEIMACLLAAIAHDLDHPGVNQTFLVATGNHLVALYESQSVLENHHWRSAISCIIESQLLEDMPHLQVELQHIIRSLILATDITRQQDYLGQFKAYLDSSTLDLTQSEHRHLILQIALKCADISNPCRPWEISQAWSLQVCEEFFRQGDVERRLNLPVSPLCDRTTAAIPTIQTGFFKYVVTPLITQWHRFLQSDLSEYMLKNLVANHTRWETYAKEKLDVTPAPEPVVDVEDEPEPANLSGSLELLLPRRSSLNPMRQPSFREQLRRFSVPLNQVFQDGRPRNRERVLQEVAGATEAEELEYISPEQITSCEKLLPEPSIASITTPMQAKRIMQVCSVDQNRKLVRQPTFPPLEDMSQALSLIPRAASQDDCVSPRTVKSDSGIKLDSNLEPTQGKFDYGSRLRENLTAIPLDLERRRKSMPTGADHLIPRERRTREIHPSLIVRTLTPRPAAQLAGRRGSAPAPGTEERPVLLNASSASAGASVSGSRLLRACQLFATPPRHALPRRSSLPVEVMTGISSR